MHTTIKGWRWCRAGIHGTLATDGTTEITTSRVAGATDHGDGTFTVRSVCGHVYRLIEPHDGAHARHMAAFAKGAPMR